MYQKKITVFIKYVLVSKIFAIIMFMGTSVNSAEIPDVYASAVKVQLELEMLRKVMKKPEDKRPPLDVVGVVPREAYFEAVSLRFRAKRLCLAEYGAESYSATKVISQGLLQVEPPKNITPQDIIALLNEVDGFIKCIKIHKKVNDKVALPSSDKSKNLVDAFKVMFLANRQLNLLLDDLVSLSDDCAMIDLAIQHVDHIINKLQPGSKGEKLAKIDNGKTITDVYQILYQAFKTIKRIEDISGIKHLEIKGGIPSKPEAGDVFDMVLFIFAELRKLEMLLNLDESYNITLPKDVKAPQVYQRAQLLLKKLKTLEEISKKQPAWLKKK